MIVKILTYPNVTKSETDNEVGHFEKMIQCNKVHRTGFKDELRLLLYQDEKLVENMIFTEKTRIFFMENGKTIDRIDFKCK